MPIKLKERLSIIVMASIGLVFLGCTMSITGAKAPGVGPLEYVDFGDFEDIAVDEGGFPEGGHLHYGGGNGGEAFVDTREARSGTQSLYVEGIGKNNGLRTHSSVVGPAKAATYQASVWYRAPEALENNQGDKLFFRIQLSGKEWEPDWIMPFPPGTQYSYRITHSTRVYLELVPLNVAHQDAEDPTDWNELAVTFTFPPEVEDEDRNIYVTLVNVSGYPVWFDDLSFQRLD